MRSEEGFNTDSKRALAKPGFCSVSVSFHLFAFEEQRGRSKICLGRVRPRQAGRGPPRHRLAFRFPYALSLDCNRRTGICSQTQK